MTTVSAAGDRDGNLTQRDQVFPGGPTGTHGVYGVFGNDGRLLSRTV